MCVCRSDSELVNVGGPIHESYLKLADVLQVSGVRLNSCLIVHIENRIHCTKSPSNWALQNLVVYVQVDIQVSNA